MKRLLLAITCLLAGTAQADTAAPALPALFDVSGVSTTDHLNVRQMPDLGATVIGTLAADEKRIEVTAFSLGGDWARINIAESTGWVARRYLAPHDQPLSATDLACFGTEPFWNMRFDTNGGLQLSTPETDQTAALDRPLQVARIGDKDFTGLRFGWSVAGTSMASLILPGQCSDGMSDRRYGLHYIDTAGPYQGCCTIN